MQNALALMAASPEPLLPGVLKEKVTCASLADTSSGRCALPPCGAAGHRSCADREAALRIPPSLQTDLPQRSFGVLVFFFFSVSGGFIYGFISAGGSSREGRAGHLAGSGTIPAQELAEALRGGSSTVPVCSIRICAALLRGPQSWHCVRNREAGGAATALRVLPERRTDKAA